MKNKLFNYLSILIVLVFFPIEIIGYLKSRGAVTIYNYIGLAILITAIVLLLIARMQLGASFTVTAQANKLVTTGLYKRFRHPIYYSGVLLFIGVAVFAQQPFILCVMILLIIVQAKRIKNEEKVLEEKFGEEYRSIKAIHGSN